MMLFVGAPDYFRQISQNASKITGSFVIKSVSLQNNHQEGTP